MAIDVLVLVALLAEERLLEEAMQAPAEEVVAGKRFVSGGLGGRQIVMTATGMGKVNAAAISMLAIQQYQPRAVIGTGIAGATDPDLLPSDVIVAERTAHHDFGEQAEERFIPWRTRSPLDFEPYPLFFPASGHLLRAAERAGAGSALEQPPELAGRRPAKVVRGTLVTGDTLGSTRENRRRLWEDFQARACDMESAAISQVCRAYGIPFLAIRGISDAGDVAMDQIEKYAAPAMRNAIRVVQSTLEGLDLSE